MPKRLFILCLCVQFLLLACTSKEPQGVLPKDKMVDVLTDYHLAEGINEVQAGGYEGRYTLAQAVFRKHGITEAQFDSTMLWYSGHCEDLTEIYDKVNRRIETMSAQSASRHVRTTSKYAELPTTGDSCNVWTFSTHTLLEPTPLRNLYRFSMQADSTYHPGDRFVWYFRTRYEMRDGGHDGIAQFTVTYANDTVASYTSNLIDDGEVELQITPIKQLDTLDIKSIAGFIYLPTTGARKQLHLLSLQDITLLRVHKKEVDEDELDELDTISTDTTQHVQRHHVLLEDRDTMPHEQKINVQKLRPVNNNVRRRTRRR